jgi:hypothetical protein
MIEFYSNYSQVTIILFNYFFFRNLDTKNFKKERKSRKCQTK